MMMMMMMMIANRTLTFSMLYNHFLTKLHHYTLGNKTADFGIDFVLVGTFLVA